MAGIGFELRKLLRKDTYWGMIQAYGYAGLISSGPWLLSILGVSFVGVICLSTRGADGMARYWSSVTYVIACSLILTGPLQLLFTRFVADRHYENRDQMIIPNLMGALIITTGISGALGAVSLLFLFEESLAYRLILLGSFVVCSNIWLVVIFLTGLKTYRSILAIFLSGYSIVVIASYLLRGFGLEGLLAGFLLGHVVLFCALLGLVIHIHPTSSFVGFEFLRKKYSFYSLAGTGFFYNFGMWSDKFVFWFDARTSVEIIGPLRGSPLYDFPVFLAYLSMIPGMAVFLFRIETDFAECYDRFYEAVREGGTLQEIEKLRNGMVKALRQAVYDIFKVQGWFVAFLVLFVSPVLNTLGLSGALTQIFAVNVLGVGGLVLLLALLNVYFYLDERRLALWLTGIFATTNLAFSWISIQMGPSFYGYGFVGSVVVTSITGLILLARQLQTLEYETFMLRN